MDDPLSSQRLEDVITFLELIESKMGKNNIDGLVEKLKMKHPKFIATLKTKIIEQVWLLSILPVPLVEY